MDVIVSLYGILFLVGVVANGTLGLALCTGPGAKHRSPLLLGVVAADFCVCCLSGPITAARYTITSWSLMWSYLAQFLQLLPICASTLSMMALSIDRFLTVKNYRPAGQVVRRRPLLLTVVTIVWLFAGVLSCFQFVKQVPWRRVCLIVRVFFVFVMPASIVIACHVGVHAKLTALSLTARAKHGELPLPMPLLRRPTHVIIVAGINRLEPEDRNGVDKADSEPEDMAQPPTSTLQSRRRLANALLAVSVYFAFSWTTHVICLLLDEFYKPASSDFTNYALFVGQMHSAFSPILYWSLNHQWLQKPCKFKFPAMYRSASSTNEAALGPFHPRLVRPPPIRRRSSHYLY